MKRFDRIKTIQLVVLVLLAVASLALIFGNRELYSYIATDPAIRGLALILWVTFGITAVFLFYDFNSYADLRRENMELDNAVYSDALTGINNRYSVDVFIGQYLNKPLPEDMACVTLDITNMAEINKKLGHSGGDLAIQAFSDILKQSSKGVCFIGRNGGNKFVAIFKECTAKQVSSFIESVTEQTAKRNAAHPEGKIDFSYGIALGEQEDVKTLTELVALSDRRAYAMANEAEL